MFNFSADELVQIEASGVACSTVQAQLRDFKTGFSYADVLRPATVGDGIFKLTSAEISELVDSHESLIEGEKIIKFTPSSGVATRMFKFLFDFLSDGVMNLSTEKFILNLNNFAFYDDLSLELKSKGFSINQLLEEKNYQLIISTLIESAGLNYGNLPKALLAFHSANQEIRTPLEEHLIEAVQYAKSEGNQVHLHFTVSPEHLNKFEVLITKIREDYERKFGVQYHFSFSEQKKSTNTIAVDLENNPFSEDRQLLFRPAGHGALLENLNDLDADIVFIKSIDNVTPDRLKADTVTYKKVIVAFLLAFQKESFSWLQRLDSGEDCRLEVVLKWLASYKFNDLNINSIEGFKNYLNRPVRVCGMVKNTGEPGGGPFWIKDGDGESLQILESAQIDLRSPNQFNLFKKSTHFNPVDLVCGIKNYEGEKYDLLDFRDDKAGFIIEKYRGDKNLKAMELPGLWNGAMANWITIFIEVPISTFNPVKFVNDLLKKGH